MGSSVGSRFRVLHGCHGPERLQPGGHKPFASALQALEPDREPGALAEWRKDGIPSLDEP